MIENIAIKLFVIAAVAFTLHHILKYFIKILENNSNNTNYKSNIEVEINNNNNSNNSNYESKMLEAEKNLLQTYYNKYSKDNKIFTQVKKGQIPINNAFVSKIGNHKYLTGKRAYQNSFVVIDIETTGLHASNDEIIEIGAIKVKDINLLIHDTFQVFIKPKKQVSHEIEKLTGITNEMLYNADKIEDAFVSFLDFIEDYPLVGHNISFDIKFLDNKMKKSKLNFSNKRLIDTLELSRKTFKNLDNHKLITLKNYLKIETEEEHRALSDAHAALILYITIINKI